MRKYSSRVLVLSLVGTAYFYFNGCSSGQEDTIKINWLIPMTGVLSGQGEPWKTSGELARKEINEAGGILGKSLELVVQDSKSDTDTASALINTMIELKKPGIVLMSEGSQGTVKAVQTVTVTNTILVMSSTASSGALSSLEDNDLFFRTVGSTSIIGPGAAKYIHDDGKDNLLIISEDNPYCKGIAQAINDSFTTTYGGTSHMILQNLPSTDQEKTDFYDSTILNAINSYNPDAIYISSYVPYALFIIQKWIADKTDFTGQWYLNEPNKSTELPRTLYADCNGMKGVALTGSGTYYDSYKSNYEDYYDTTIPVFPRMPEVYDMIYLAALAIQKAGTDSDATAISAALREVAKSPGTVFGPGDFQEALELITNGQEIDYHGASGPLEFDEYGNVPVENLELWRIDNGNFVREKIMTPGVDY